MSQETNRFEFGDYVLDTGEKILLRDGKAIPVPPKVLDLLLVLVENHGHVVEKEVLMEKLWSDTFVEESNLTFSIRKLRKILGDETHNPKFIETVPKRGYRFVAVTNSSNDLVDRPRLADTDGNGSETDISKPSSLGRTHSYLLWASLSVVLLVGLTALFLWFAFDKVSSISSIKLERLTFNGKVKIAAISPDGKFVAYVVDDEGMQSIWLKNTGAEGDVQVLPAVADTQLYGLFFAPDGDHIYYVANDTLYHLPILGGSPREVLRSFGAGSRSKSIAASPDEKHFAFIRHTANGPVLVVVNADGSDERILASGPDETILLRSVVWSPDSKNIALVAVIAAGKQSIAVVRVADGAVSTISTQPTWSSISQIAWRPDGGGLYAVAMEGRNLSSQVWHLSYPEGGSENITNDFNNYQSISVTSDGTTLAAVRVEQSAHIWISATEDGSHLTQLTHGIEGYDGVYGLDYLSNGNVVYESTPGEKGQVWSVASNGGDPKQLLTNSGSSAASPDGKYVVFQSVDDAGSIGLFKYDIGNGQKTRLTTGRDTWMTFSPDSRWVIFSRWENEAALWKVSVDGGEAVKLTDLSGYALAPAVSADGKVIAFHWAKRDQKNTSEIGIMPFEGGNLLKTLTIPKRPPPGYGKPILQWTPDGKAINYADFHENASNIWRQPLDGGLPIRVTNFNDQQIFNFSYSPEGEQLALSRGTYARDVVLLKFAGK